MMGSGRGAIAALGLSVSLAAACRRAPPPPPPPPPAAAVVNGVAIPVAKLQLELDRVRRGEAGDVEASVAGPEAGRRPDVEAPAAGPGKLDAGAAQQDLPALGRALLEGLIDRAIVLQQAKEAGLQVSEAEVQRATEALADDARKGGAAWNEQLDKAGQNAEQLSDELREAMLAGKFMAAQTSKERASPAETRAWFDAHRALFEEAEQVHCLQLVVRTPEEAKSALDQLRAGASFDKLARQLSTSPDGRNGGDLGWFSKGTMPKVFDDACFSLPSGKLSGVVASPYGYHVFKVLGRRGGRQRSFKDAQADAERRATAEKRADAERQLLSQLRASSEVKIDESALALLK